MRREKERKMKEKRREEGKGGSNRGIERKTK